MVGVERHFTTRTDACGHLAAVDLERDDVLDELSLQWMPTIVAQAEVTDVRLRAVDGVDVRCRKRELKSHRVDTRTDLPDVTLKVWNITIPWNIHYKPGLKSVFFYINRPVANYCKGYHKFTTPNINKIIIYTSDRIFRVFKTCFCWLRYLRLFPHKSNLMAHLYQTESSV